MSLTAVFKTIESEVFFSAGNEYQCQISNQLIPDVISEIVGKHESSYSPMSYFDSMSDYDSNEDVKEVKFFKCELSRLPQGLTKIFPNMKNLVISDSSLKTVTKDDLAEYSKLKKICFNKTKIEFLPGNLFEDFKHLEEIRFSENPIKIIDPTILEGLKKLQAVDFRNEIYHSYYERTYNGTGLRNVKEELRQVFCKGHHVKNILRKEYEGEVPSKRVCTESLNQNNLEAHQDLSYCVKNLIQDDTFKDFKIQVDGRYFHVHKFLLVARSPTLAEVIKNNPAVESLKLIDIPVDIFESILKYIYTDELPPFDGLNLLHLFAAAGRLKIMELKNFAAQHILNKIDTENALEVLNLSNKYEHDEIRQKAFDEIKKTYPKIDFDSTLAMEPESVAIIVEKFKEKEEAIRQVEEAFKKGLEQKFAAK